MLNYFCPSCGGKNLYQFQKPKFCSHCGSSFSIAGSTISQIKSSKFEANVINPIQIKKNNHIDDFNDDDQDFSSDYSSMQGLDVNIEKYNKNEGIKLGDLVSDEPIQKQPKLNKKITKQKRGRKKIVKSLPESFISEAKMSGRNYQSNNDINIIDNEE